MKKGEEAEVNIGKRLADIVNNSWNGDDMGSDQTREVYIRTRKIDIFNLKKVF